MTKLYPRDDVQAITAPNGVEYPVVDGEIDVPEPFASELNRVHVGGVKAFETNAERTARLMAAEAKRRRDPEALLSAVERLGGFDVPGDENDPLALRARAARLIAQADAIESP